MAALRSRVPSPAALGARESPDMSASPSMRCGFARCGVVAQWHMERPAPAKSTGAMPGLALVAARIPIVGGRRAGGLSRPPARMLAAQRLEVGPEGAKRRLAPIHSRRIVADLPRWVVLVRFRGGV